MNKEGRLLVKFLEDRGWETWNGNIEGDREGECTFTGGRGGTVIDYILGEEETREWVAEMKVGDKVDSDHHPVEVRIKGRGKKKRREREEKKGMEGALGRGRM